MQPTALVLQPPSKHLTGELAGQPAASGQLVQSLGDDTHCPFGHREGVVDGQFCSLLVQFDGDTAQVKSLHL